jgi:hypothetical protein
MTLQNPVLVLITFLKKSSARTGNLSKPSARAGNLSKSSARTGNLLKPSARTGDFFENPVLVLVTF